MNDQTMNSQELQDLAALRQIHKGKGVGAIVLGIISLIGCLGPISFICGIIAICLGASARKKSRKTTGTAGMVLGIVGVMLSAVTVLTIVLMLSGVMGPQLLAYSAKADASNDMMVCDAVRSAVTTAMLDPEVVTDEASTEFIQQYCQGGYYDVEILFEEDNAFTETFRSYMDADSYDDILDSLKSKDADSIEFAVEDGIYVIVRIPGTDIEIP